MEFPWSSGILHSWLLTSFSRLVRDWNEIESIICCWRNQIEWKLLSQNLHKFCIENVWTKRKEKILFPSNCKCFFHNNVLRRVERKASSAKIAGKKKREGRTFLTRTRGRTCERIKVTQENKMTRRAQRISSTCPSERYSNYQVCPLSDGGSKADRPGNGEK